jgi:hypothetical protein
MKTEFLKSFSKDLDKITLKNKKDSIAHTIEQVESAGSVRQIKNHCCPVKIMFIRYAEF